MQRSSPVLVLALAVGVALAAPPARCEEKPQPARPKHPDAGSEMAAAMAEWARLTSPGPEHRKLEPLVGQWTAVSRFWPDPGAPPEESKGACLRKWAMDGRFILEEYDGQAMGRPFHGLGILGYDNVKKQYNSVWIDTMSTAVMISFGAYDAGARRFEYTGEVDDCMTGRTKRLRSTLRLVNDRTQVFEMFEPGPDGKEFRNLEITYTRK